MSTTSEVSLPNLVLKAISLLLFICVGAYGNLLVLYTVLIADSLRPALNLCIASLSAADLVICVILMPLTFASLIKGEWIIEYISCVLHNALVVYFGQVAALSITSIVYERYRRITLRRFPSLTSLQISLLLCIVWGLPIPFLVPMFRQDMVYFPESGMCFNNFTAHTEEWNGIFIANAIVVGCSAFLIAFSFWKIYITLRPLRMRVSCGSLPNKEVLMFAAHVHSAWTSIWFVSLYVLMAAPVYVTLSVDQYRRFYGKQGVSDAAVSAVLWLFWFQCCVKPIIYAWRSERFIGGRFCCFQFTRPPTNEQNGTGDASVQENNQVDPTAAHKSCLPFQIFDKKSEQEIVPQDLNLSFFDDIRTSTSITGQNRI